jgi:hypothetical protein
VDLLKERPGGYQGLDSSTELRIRERAAWDAYRRYLDAEAIREANDTAEMLNRVAGERDEAREAMASALTSLGTGPLKDGYAYAVLEEALRAGDSEEENRVGSNSIRDLRARVSTKDESGPSEKQETDPDA